LVDVASPHLEAVVRVARVLESSALEIGGVMKKKIGWGILGTVAVSLISLVVHEAPARDLEILGVYFAVVGLIALGLYMVIEE
jgi:hypothetical protein